MLNMPYSVSGDHLFLALFTKIHLQFVSPLERGIQHSTRVSTAACCSSGGGMADVRPHPHDVMVHTVLSDVAEATDFLRVICPPPLMPCAA